MPKNVLNTIIVKKISLNTDQKYIFWGAALTKDILTKEAVLALNGAGVGTGRELRYDRFATLGSVSVPFNLPNVSPIGVAKYLVICIPVAFGFNGIVLVNNGLTYNFEEINTVVDFIDELGVSYPMQVFMSYDKFNGIVTSLKIL